MDNVVERGDAAIIEYTEKLDGVRLNSLKVTEEEFEKAYSMVTRKQIQAINVVKARLMESEVSVMNNLKGITILSDGIKVHRLVQAISPPPNPPPIVEPVPRIPARYLMNGGPVDRELRCQ